MSSRWIFAVLGFAASVYAHKPTYGIIGLVHMLPPALAWLWRLVAPHGHGNPSIISQEGMQSEGVGAWIQCGKIGPFPLVLLGREFWSGMRDFLLFMVDQGVFDAKE